MPAPTFASAAAGNSSDASGNRTRTESAGIGEWSRRPNGATQTFRRSSYATSQTNLHQRDPSAASASAAPQSAGAYVPPHLNSTRNGPTVDTRYSKQQLLDLYREQREFGDLEEGLAELSVGDWHANLVNEPPSRWNKKDDYPNDTGPGPDVCWLREGGSEPLGLFDMTEEEQELFSTTVNAPIKGPNTNRESSQRESLGGRKSSFSQGTASLYGLTSPTTTKPMTRRREGSESFSRDALASPTSTTSRFFRDDNPAPEPPPSLIRRRTDMKDSASGPIAEEQDIDSSTTSTGAFGSLKRTATQPLGASLNGPSSPWSAGATSTFGNFAFSGSGLTSNEKRPGFVRGESRFKGLMSKDSSEDVGFSVKEQPSHSSLHKFGEGDAPRQNLSGYDETSQRPTSGATDPYSGDANPSGSAALGGETPPHLRSGSHHGTPQRQDLYEDQAYARFGMTTDRAAFGDSSGRQYAGQNYTGQTAGSSAPEEPLSPTFTNPYQSPENRTSQMRSYENEASGSNAFHLPGLGGFGGDMGQEQSLGQADAQGKVRFPPNYDPRQVDLGQNPPSVSTRGFPSLGGLGGLGRLSGDNWSTGPTAGTPSRERAAFENLDIRSPAAMQSPGLGSLGGPSLNQPIGSGVGRSSRMGSLFPPAMQEQMRGTDQGHVGTPGERDDMGEDPMASRTRDTDSPFRTGITGFDEQNDFASEHGMPGLGQQYPQDHDKAALSAVGSVSGFGQGQQHASINQTGRMMSTTGGAGSNQPPAPQQKTMVMPDRIRWIYRDPQGNTQGPWSGLEMHDWYRAGFFSPELLVKKAEDPDYEPLAQLIRRIGNSREPFLVPQIGIPGPPSSHATTSWPNQQPPPPNQPTTGAPSAQPPFASSFPSFGTTLTADQQNALERRKQEEQYLMARQKEHLAQQQVIMKQMQMQNQQYGSHQQQQLQHHSSAHSLHSQPSHGSITSPTAGFPGLQSPTSYPSQGMPNLFDNSTSRGTGIAPVGSGLDSLGDIKEEDIPALLERMNLERSGQTGDMSQLNRFQYSDSTSHDQRVTQAFGDRARLEREQAMNDSTHQHNQEILMNDRLQQFRDLQEQIEEEAFARQRAETDLQQREQGHREHEMPPEYSEGYSDEAATSKGTEAPPQGMSLSEQVQKAASAKQSPTQEKQSPWAKVESGVPMPFPPPQSISPLPAPAARRSRQNVADALAAESSQSASPSVETPGASVAPWAREPAETQKQPSLREIQEAEARRAAKQEELAIAARRAALEKEMMNQPIPPAPGLPSTSTWGSGESPISSSSINPAVWGTKAPVPGKLAVNTGSKKTLQQIQKEEEARKQKVAASASSNASIANSIAGAAQAMSSGKRYADLAGKGASPSPASPGGGAWTTVGASGKTKVPTTPTAPIALNRTASGSTPSSTTATSATRPKAVATPPANTIGLATAKATAQEEFKKWAVTELRPDISKGVQVDDFVTNLLNLGTDVDIITEAVHSVSSTLDSRHFAEEFVRRRGLADKGKTDPSTSSFHSSEPKSATAGSSSGWSEVARKGPTATTPKEESSGYKIVAAKKKGSKR